MDDLILILSKSLLIFLGIFIMSISNKFSFNFLLPDKNKFIVVFDNTEYQVYQVDFKGNSKEYVYIKAKMVV